MARVVFQGMSLHYLFGNLCASGTSNIRNRRRSSFLRKLPPLALRLVPPEVLQQLQPLVPRPHHRFTLHLSQVILLRLSRKAPLFLQCCPVLLCKVVWPEEKMYSGEVTHPILLELQLSQSLLHGVRIAIFVKTSRR
jgi:hypothetical protein